MLDDTIYIYAILGLNGSLPLYTIRLLKYALCCVSDMKERSIEYLVISSLVKTSMNSHMVNHAHYHHTIYHANYHSSVAYKNLSRPARSVNLEFTERE